MYRLCVLGGWVCVSLFLLAGPARGQEPEYLGKTLARWAADLNSNDPVARRGAVFALGKMSGGAAGMVPQLLRALRDDKNAAVREVAASALGEVCKSSPRAPENANVISALLEALKDSEPLVKRSAAVALGNLKDEARAAQTPLEALLKHPNPAVRQNAAWALGQIGADSVDGLREVLGDRDALVRRDAANALGEMGKKARPALPELLACCKHPDAEVKKAVLRVLIRLVDSEDTKACKTLQQALADRDVDVRRNAALAMANIGGPEAAPAVPVLVEALQKGDLETRRQAAAAVKNIGPDARAALNPLRQALKDRDPELRANATLGLGGLRQEATSAVPELVALLADRSEKEVVRVEAAVALSQIGAGPAAREAIPTLIRVVEDTHNPVEVRERTLWAVRVHEDKLKDYPDLFAVLTRVIAEPKTQDSRMMRYDSAFLLGYFQRDKAPAQALDVLLEFLKDDTIRIYKKGTVWVSPVKDEIGPGIIKRKEIGVSDGRVMAVVALRRIGAERVRPRQDIVRQLRALESDLRTLPELRDDVRKLLSDFGL